MSEKLKILFVASEVSPLVKTGGLADVAGSLPQALKKLGHEVKVVMPEYSQIDDEYLKEVEHVTDFQTRVCWREKYTGVNRIKVNEVPTYLIDNKYYFNRFYLYDNDDKPEQFTFFARAVLEMLPKIDFQPDIIHCNDWQTGPISLLLEDNYKQYDFYQDIKTIFTIHNLRYQGQFDKEILYDVLGVSEEHWYSGEIRHDNQVNFMKTGIMYSDIITTVSETYAEEIKRPELGEGLDYALRMRGDDLYGIVNGISYEEFDPKTDPRIYVNYDKDNIEKKYENKIKLQQDMGLPQNKDIPVLGFISRLVRQKGLDLITVILEELIQEDLQFIMLGTGEYEYEKTFSDIAERYPDKMAANIKYDANLAQKIYAGIDIFLMPSLYEPCGLGQLISMRYGTIPVVRETGGLNDTVHSFNEETETGNGFSFTYYDAEDFLYTINRALGFYEKPEIWRKLVKRVMKEDFSWKHSARNYIDLYQLIN